MRKEKCCHLLISTFRHNKWRRGVTSSSEECPEGEENWDYEKLDE